MYELMVILVIPLAINAFTGYFFYKLGIKTEAAKQQETLAKQQETLSNSYLSYGFVDLKGGPGTTSSTDVIATVYLYSSRDFKGIALWLSGAHIKGRQGNNLSDLFDTDASGPQPIKFHLTGLVSEVTTCLSIPTSQFGSNTIKRVRIEQSFKPRSVDSAGTQVVEFTSIGEKPLVEKNNDGMCPAIENSAAGQQ